MWTQLTPSSVVPKDAEFEMRIFHMVIKGRPTCKWRHVDHQYVGMLDFEVSRVVHDLAPPINYVLGNWACTRDADGPLIWRCKHNAYDHRKPDTLLQTESDFVQVLYRDNMSDYVLK